MGKTLPFSEPHSLYLKMGIDIPANTTQWGVWHLVGTHFMLVKLGFWRASNEVVDGQVIRKKDQRQTQSPALLSWSLTLSSSSSIWRQQIRSPLPSHQAPSAAKETGERFINHLGWCQTLEISQCMLMPLTFTETCWNFRQAYLTLIHLWRKERLYYWYEEIAGTKNHSNHNSPQASTFTTSV